MANIFLTQVPGEGGFNWLNTWGAQPSFPVGAPANSTAILAQLTPTPDPSGDSVGGSGLPGANIFHVTVTPASGAGTYTFLHGLTYTPLVAWAFIRITEGTTPTVFSGFEVGDTNSNMVAFNFGGNGTWDVYYG